jgi:hypothetical protein
MDQETAKRIAAVINEAGRLGCGHEAGKAETRGAFS